MYELPQFNTLSINLRHAYKSFESEVAFELMRGIPFRLAALHACRHINKAIQTYGDFYMPRKAKPKNDAYGFSWVRVSLSEQETEQFTAWYNSGAGDVYELLQAMLVEGDKVSISYSEKQDSFYATIMGGETSHRNAGKGFSSFAKTPEQAIALAVYKYHHVIDGNMSDVSATQDAEFG